MNINHIYTFTNFFYRGYRTVVHGGSLWGHYSRLELFPDINLGVYSSINGQEGFPSAMESIGLYAGKSDYF